MECNEPAYKLALLGRIGACLALLRPTLSEPIPAHLIERFTVDALPETPSYFEPDAEAWCEYCQTLTLVLCQQSLLPEMEKSLRGLLCELMWMFAGGVKRASLGSPAHRTLKNYPSPEPKALIIQGLFC